MKRLLVLAVLACIAGPLGARAPEPVAAAAASPEQSTTPPVKPPPAQKPDPPGRTVPTIPTTGTATTTTGAAGKEPTVAGATPGSTAQPLDYTFPSGAGMFFFYVKPDKGPNFEDVVHRINEVLEKSQDPARRQQAAGWKIYKSLETPKDGLIYIFVFDPAIAGVDYDPVRLLSETLPADVQGLYDRLKDALIRVERMGLAKIR